MEFKLADMLRMKSLRMDEIIRYSGIHSVKPETLSHHVVEVQLMSLKIAYAIESESGYKIDKESLLMKSLLHDLDEVVTGDFPRPIKYWSGNLKDEIEEMSKSVISKMSKKEFGSSEVYTNWLFAKSDFEGLIVKSVDLLVVAKKALEEVALYNNYSFVKVLEEVKDYLKEFIAGFTNNRTNGLTAERYRAEDILMDLMTSVRSEIIVYLVSMSRCHTILPYNDIQSISSYKDYYTTKEGDKNDR